VRAFNQQDWLHEGILTRPNVVQMCSEVLQRANVTYELDSLKRRAVTFDTNRDGQIDKEEFVTLIDDLIQVTAEVRKMSQFAEFERLGRNAREVSAKRRRMSPSPSIVPWIWSVDRKASTPYRDMITMTSHFEPPPSRCTDALFATMATEAEVYVGKISDFQSRWLGIVRTSLQRTFLEALNSVRGVALQFVLFEPEQYGKITDLDILISSIRVLINTKTPLSFSGDILRDVKNVVDAWVSSQNLLASIQGFCSQFQRFSSAPNISPQNRMIL
jgi:hypothetical protein